MLQGIKELTAIQVPWIKLVSQAGKVSGQNREFILNGLMVQFEKKNWATVAFPDPVHFVFLHTLSLQLISNPPQHYKYFINNVSNYVY